MANYFDEIAEWKQVRIVDVDDPVTGGPTGTVNRPLEALTKRDNYILSKIDEVHEEIDDIDLSPYATKESPIFTGVPKAPTPPEGTSNNQIATTEFVISNGLPVGVMLDFAGKKAPMGFLLCDGSAISRTTYARLFAVIGTEWGEGDGKTTFNLPDTRKRFAEGAEKAGGYTKAGLPNISGAFKQWKFPGAEGAFYNSGSWGSAQTKDGGGDSTYKCWFDASRSNSVYGNSDTVQPASYKVMKIIKY